MRKWTLVTLLGLGVIIAYIDQIGREPMSAINVIDKMQELAMRDGLLVTFEKIPSRLVPKDANIVRRLNTCCNNRRQ